MSFLSEYWPYLTVAAGAVLLALGLLFVTRARRKRKEPLEVELEAKERWPLKAGRSVTPDQVRMAQDELRVLGLEKEIVSYAIRRLYEAEAEGKISKEERDHLASQYRERMERIEETISKSGSMVALHELETMQEDLLKLFSERFSDLNQKIEELRSRLEIKPAREAPAPSPAPLSPAAPEKEGEKRRRPPAPRKTEAEERIEKIRAEIEKVLERLGQIETEA